VIVIENFECRTFLRNITVEDFGTLYS